MAGGAPPGERSLAETPTWAVAGVCAIFVFISVMIEHLIHILTKWFQKRQKKAMSEALEKIKAELMLLGFISLLLTVGTPYVANICMSEKFTGSMLPCYKQTHIGNVEDGSGRRDGDGNRRRLLSYDESGVWRRVLAGAGGTDKCSEQKKVALVSQSGLHQLHIFIFVLTVLHVLYSGITMTLSQAKMKKWKAWESETSSMEYQFNNDPERFRFAHQTSFVRRHSGLSRKPGIKWIVAFFRQFFGSISKVDYMTMRHGFINAHLAPSSKFDFHKYIKRSMEDDFKVVVGISIPLWVFAIIFLLLNVYKWHTLSYLAIVPLAILLLVGTKLELIIMEMAQSIQNRSTVVRGAPLVEPSNEYFWFKQPKWVLFLIHFTLFQNAFQMAYFLWIFYEFGLKSCFHENLAKTFARVLLGVASQILCSYITFPLYALVTQMGSHMKRAIFEEQTAKALMKWQKAAREKSKLRKAGVDVSNSGYLSGETTPSRGTSPLHLLHKYRSSLDAESVATSPVSYLSDTELSEIEVAMQGKGDKTRQEEVSARNTEPQNGDFSFVTP